MADYVISVDLGGTRIRVALINEQLQLIERKETLTLAYEGLEPTIGRIKALIREVFPEDRSLVSRIGISAPSAVNTEKGTVVAPPNLPGWHHVPLAKMIEDEFQLPTYLGNDANVAALAEAALGAAQGYDHSIYLTISTGIGSGMIVDGILLTGATGLAAEAGHVILLTENGKVSSLELEAAGPALARQARAAMEAGEESIMQVLCGGDLSAVDARTVGSAALRGDALAVRIIKRAGYIVGLGITSLLHIFNPQVVVIGGGVTNVGDILLDAIWETVREHALDQAYWEDLIIVRSTISEDVSLLGAAALAFTAGGMESITEFVSHLGES
ncbi:MAG: ROK family protein [Anaerolineae bacterium]|nr:ROK family protein [Anaerolineae bacterium]